MFALGAVVAKQRGDEQARDHYLTKFKEVGFMMVVAYTSLLFICSCW